MEAYGKVEVHLHVPSTSALTESKCQASRPGRLTSEERPPYPPDRSLEGGRGGLDDVGQELEARPFGI
jgi:hypothetical protein